MTPKPVAKKASPKKAAAKKRGPTTLYADAALAAVIGNGAAKAPAAVRGVLAYVKQHELQGAGAMRGVVSCDATLRALFGTAVVKLNQLPKLVKPHLVSTPPAAASQLDWTAAGAPATTPTDSGDKQ